MKKKNLLHGTLFSEPIDHSRCKVNPLSMNLPLKSKQPDNRGSLSKRLQKTPQNLKTVKREISSLEKDVEVLEARAFVAENLLNLSDKQIQAVLSLYKTTSEKKERLRFWLSIFITFVLSSIMAVIIAIVLQ